MEHKGRAAGAPWRLGIIGAGYVTEAYHLPVLRDIERIQLVWLCDKDLDRARSLGRSAGVKLAFTRIEEAPEVDFVLVTVPAGARRPVLDQVLGRGWPAFCEKPFAATLEDHEHIMAEARRVGVRLGIGLVRRFYHSTQAAARLLAGRMLGPVESVVAGEGTRVQKTGRGAGWYQADPRAVGGGVLAETGTHVIDQVFQLTSAKSFELSGAIQKEVQGLEFETVAKARLELAGGERVPFSLMVSKLSDVFNGISVRCERGELRLGLGPDAPVELYDRAGRCVSRVPSTFQRMAAMSAAVRGEWLDFLDRLAEGPGFDPADTGYLAAAFIDACYRQGRREHLSQAELGGLT